MQENEAKIVEKSLMKELQHVVMLIVVTGYAKRLKILKGF